MEIQTENKEQLSFRPEDFASDIEKLRAKQAPEVVVQEDSKVASITPTVELPAQLDKPAAVTPSEPVKQEPAPAPQAVAVPDKFKSPDGTLDVAKLEKSSINVDQALAKYLEKEKELKRKINEVKMAENAYLAPTTPAPSQTNTPPANIPFQQQIEKDIQEQGVGVVLAKLFTASQEAALEQARKELTPLRQGFEEATTRQQVEAIGKSDPWVYTEDGVTTLNRILTEQPYLMQAADPYKAAYVYHRGLRGVTAKTERVDSQVLTPTPPAKASAPVPTAVAANMTPPAQTISLNDHVAVEAHLKTLTPEQVEEFYVKLGYPAFKAV